MIEMTEDERAAIRAQFGELNLQTESSGEPIVFEQPAPKRGRGRPKLPRTPTGEIIREPSAFSNTPAKTDDPSGFPVVPLTKRDEKEVSKRLANIMQGVTGVVGVANEAFEMTDEEATAIAEPLSSYLIRAAPTSKVARQILDEYDLVAVATGSAAYGVRVYKDLKKERDANKPHVAEDGLEPIKSKRPSKSNTTNDGRVTTGNEEPAGEVRTFGTGHIPVVPGDGVLTGL